MRSVRMMILSLVCVILLFLAGALTLASMGYFGFPFSVKINGGADRSYVFEVSNTAQHDDILNALKKFSDKNRLTISVTAIPGSNGKRMNVIMKNDNIGEFVVDNHLSEKRFVCMYYAQGHTPAEYKVAVSAFETLFVKAGGRLVKES